MNACLFKMIFDVNETLFDPAPVSNSVDQALGTQGAGTPWFLSLPHHSLVMTVTEQHAEFPRISSALLQMLGRQRGRTIGEGAARDALADGASYGSPVCRVRLARLRNAGFRLVATSNRTRVRYYLEKRDPEFDRKMHEVLMTYRDVSMYQEGAVHDTA